MENPLILTGAEIERADELAFGGALEGAEMLSRETAAWFPSMQSPDQIINSAKPLADARGRDRINNDGYVSGAEDIHKDSIVGGLYRLNAAPDWRMLGADEAWAEEFQLWAESIFGAIAESPENYLDAARKNTLTEQVRLAVGIYMGCGEVLATAEWMDPEASLPCRTAIQMVSPDRLSNPNGASDTEFMRRGIEQNKFGAAIAYHIRTTYPTEAYPGQKLFNWRRVAARKPWGRQMVIHIFEQRLPSQSRGISAMVSVLKQMKMTSKFQDITLQNAVVNASYAAAIESELPDSDVFAAMGAGVPQGLTEYIGTYMGALNQYLEGSKGIAIDGAKIPHLFPGTKLNMQPVGTPGGVGTGFEQSLLRHIAAALGLSYEQFSRDYTNTNYSSARASMNETWKFMQSRKKLVADKYATSVYRLWLEEEVNAGRAPLPPGKTAAWFYEPLVKDLLSRCTWIGASRGQIDEFKETQAAVLRINSGLSTREKECARLGDDWRETMSQLAREKRMETELGLSFATTTNKPGVSSESKEDANTDDNKETTDE